MTLQERISADMKEAMKAKDNKGPSTPEPEPDPWN